MMARKDIIGIFGGTFDPPHLGHTGLAREILNCGAAEEIVFVPAPVPPHKPGSPSADFADRLKMLELAVAGVPHFSVSDIEGRREGPSYTYDTLTELSAMFSGAEIRLVLGADSLETLHSWHKGRDIVREWKLIVYPRPGHSPSEASLSENWDSVTAAGLAASILPIKAVFDIASTEIRYRIRQGKTLDGLLAPQVLRHIREKGLYKGDCSP